MRVNRFRVYPDSEGWGASFVGACGHSETIEGLYDFQSALAWTHMHQAFHCSRHHHCSR